MPVTLLDADDCVLIVVDVQPGFFRTPEPATESVLARARWLVALARRLGVPVVVTEEDAERNGPTHAAIAEVLAAGSPVLDKPTFAVTGTPPIMAAIEATGRRTAVLVGFETDVCVAQSAVGLRALGMRVVVVQDAVFSPGQMHTYGLSRMAAARVELNHAKGVGYEWVRTVERSRRIIDADPDLNPAPFPL